MAPRARASLAPIRSRPSPRLALLACFALGAAACGTTERSNGGTRRSDASSTFHPDAAADPADAGELPEADAGQTGEPDAASGNRDATTIHPDAFVPPNPDASTPDSGVLVDAGVVPIDLRVRDIQDPSSAVHPAADTVVRLSNVVVTAVYPGGQNLGSFWAEEQVGGPYSGIYVYVPMALIGRWPVAIGDRVTLSGRYIEYFDLSEIVLDNVESVSAGTPLNPDVRTASDLVDTSPVAEAWEGVLVRIDNLFVTSTNPDAPQDFGEFTANDVRVNDALYRVDPRPLDGQSVQSLTGVLHYTFSHFKLLPRSAADVGLIQ